MSRDYHTIIFELDLNDAIEEATRLARKHLEIEFNDYKLPNELEAYFRGWIDCAYQINHILSDQNCIKRVKKDDFELMDDE